MRLSAAPCQETSALRLEACCVAAGAEGVGQSEGFGEVVVDEELHWVESAGM